MSYHCLTLYHDQSTSAKIYTELFTVGCYDVNGSFFLKPTHILHDMRPKCILTLKSYFVRAINALSKTTLLLIEV